VNGLDNLSRTATRSAAQRAFDQGGGVLRLAPTWVPRSFCVPGRRIKLDPGDYFALGGARGESTNDGYRPLRAPAESPVHTLDESVAILSTIDAARAQLTTP
jgi:hypothetical protein